MHQSALQALRALASSPDHQRQKQILFCPPPFPLPVSPELIHPAAASAASSLHARSTPQLSTVCVRVPQRGLFQTWHPRTGPGRAREARRSAADQSARRDGGEGGLFTACPATAGWVRSSDLGAAEIRNGGGMGDCDD
ncbi:hypothetical protein V496_06606, partial [Pseudogymnoascus sp. VKM F-4515 (FW-2607)]